MPCYIIYFILFIHCILVHWNVLHSVSLPLNAGHCLKLTNLLIKPVLKLMKKVRKLNSHTKSEFKRSRSHQTPPSWPFLPLLHKASWLFLTLKYVPGKNCSAVRDTLLRKQCIPQTKEGLSNLLSDSIDCMHALLFCQIFKPVSWLFISEFQKNKRILLIHTSLLYLA